MLFLLIILEYSRGCYIHVFDNGKHRMTSHYTRYTGHMENTQNRQEARSISPRSREPRSPIKAIPVTGVTGFNSSDTFDTQVVRREARHGAAPEDAPTSPLRPKDWGTTRLTLHSALSHSKALQTWIIWCHMIMINRHDEYVNVMDDDVWHVCKTVAWCRGQRSRVLLQKKEVLFRVCRRSRDIQGLICVLDHHGFIMIYSIFFGFSKKNVQQNQKILKVSLLRKP